MQQRINDEDKAMRARTEGQRRALAQAQLDRSRKKLRDARKQQREIRTYLLLDDEEPDGKS